MIRSDAPPLSNSAWEATRRLALEAATAQVVGSLSGLGVRSILLKGPALAGWLYGAPDQRPYGDVDLLVAPHQFDLAETCLGPLGFSYRRAGARPHEQVRHAHHWMRRAPAPSGRGPPPLAVLDPDRRCDGVGDPEPGNRRDRGRGSQRGGARPPSSSAARGAPRRPARSTTRESRCVTSRGRSRSGMTASGAKPLSWPRSWMSVAHSPRGCDCDPAGIELAARLGLEARTSSELRLFAVSPPPTSVGFHRLAEAGILAREAPGRDREGLSDSTIAEGVAADRPARPRRGWPSHTRGGRCGLPGKPRADSLP